MTGSVAQTVLYQDYLYNNEDDMSDTNLKFFDVSFNYQSFLNIPLEKEFDADNPLFKQLKDYIVRQILLNTAKIINSPLADQMSSISKLRFFSLQEFEGRIHLLAKLTEKEHLLETKKLKNELGGIHIGWGKSKFFMLPNIGSADETTILKSISSKGAELSR
jgi:hypothetical protein